MLSDDVRLASKRSIQAPQNKWLSSPSFRNYINDILHSKIFKELDLFNVKECKKYYSNHLKSPSNNSVVIWQWINCYEMYRIFLK